MAGALNAHKVFFDAPEAPDFWTRTRVPDPKLETLRAARKEVRDTLSRDFQRWSE